MKSERDNEDSTLVSAMCRELRASTYTFFVLSCSDYSASSSLSEGLFLSPGAACGNY